MKKLCCAVNLGIRKNKARRSTEGEASPVKDSKSDKTGRGSAPEPAPRGNLHIGVDTSTLADREPLLERELRTTF